MKTQAEHALERIKNRLDHLCTAFTWDDAVQTILEDAQNDVTAALAWFDKRPRKEKGVSA